MTAQQPEHCEHEQPCRFANGMDAAINDHPCVSTNCKFDTRTRPHPAPAQQRIDAAIKELQKLSKAKWDAAEKTKNVTFSYEGIGVDEAIALLQAGGK